MAGELVTYTGRVPAGGLRWVRGHPADQEPGHGPQMFLVPVSAGDHAEATYDLHDLDVVLFQVFAETAPTAEGILAFAARYGRLGIDVPIRLAAPDASGPMPEPRGEPLTLWQREISLMVQLLDVWHLYRAGNAARLSRHIGWESDGEGRMRAAFRSHVTVEPQEGREGSELTLGHLKTHETIATMDRPFDAGEVMPPNDVLRYALSYVQQRLDVQLRRHEGRASPSMTLHPTRGKPLLRFAASSLGAALWLQVADALVNERVYGRCKECNKWFEVAPEAARSHRRFCSAACRSKAYRLRQDRARQMHFANKSFDEIADELDCTIEAVRRWITGMK